MVPYRQRKIARGYQIERIGDVGEGLYKIPRAALPLGDAEDELETRSLDKNVASH
jgi:hypothetical protein